MGLKRIFATAVGCIYFPIVCFVLLINWILKGINPFKGSKWNPLPSFLEDRKYGVHKTAYLTNSYGKINIHYVESGNLNKPLIVFVHGFPDFWYGWQKQIFEFQKTNHVVAMDLRGYGLSDKPQNIESYKISYLTEDVCSLIKYLGKEAHLVAHDWGGVIAWRVHNDHPELLKSVTCLNAPHPKAMLKALYSSTQFFRSWYMFLFQLPCFPERLLSMNNYKIFRLAFKKVPGSFSDDDIDALIAAFSTPGVPTASLNYYRSSFSYNCPLAKRQKGVIYPPSCVIWGTEDTALSSSMAETSLKAAQDLTGCLGRVVLIKNATHFVQKDQSEKVNSTLQEFFKEVNEAKYK